MTEKGPTRPPLSITLRLEDETEYTVKMSYGLFQDLQRMVPDTAAIVDTILADPFAREYCLRRAMTPTKKIIADAEKELIPAEDVKLDDPDEINKLLQWIVGHLLYFFATSAGGLKQLSVLFKALDTSTQDQPAPSTPGSQN